MDKFLLSLAWFITGLGVSLIASYFDDRRRF